MYHPSIMDKSKNMSGSAFSTPVLLQREHIQHEIAVLHELIRQRKTRLNTLASVSTLPPEILAEIFICIAIQIESRYAPYWMISHAQYSWIKMSHACKHWREVASAFPSLWTFIVTSSRMEWISLLLERSKQAPLRIDIKDDSNMEQACEVMLKEIHRTQNLRICIPTPALRNLFGQIGGPIPLLETLLVDVDDRREQIAESLSALLQCHLTPRLHQLEISWHTIHWNYLTSMTLKHLKVTDYPSQVRLDPVHFFAILEKFPLLESFDLQGHYIAFNDHITAVTPPTKVLTLTRLRSICIMATTNNCINIFNHLSLPELSSITVDCINMGDGTALARSLADKMTSLEKPRTLFVNNFTGYIRIYEFTVVAPDLTTHCMDRYPPATIDLTFSERSWTNAMLDILPLAGVRSAVFTGGVFNSKEEWLDVFRQLQNVEVLHVDQDWPSSSDDLPEALRHRESGVSMEGEQSRPVYTYRLPNLRMLKLSGVYFAGRGTYKKGRLGKFENALHDCLMERYEYGAEIRSLFLIRCKNLDWCGIQKLIDIIGRSIFWDSDISLTDYQCEKDEVEEEIEDEDEVEDEEVAEDEGEAEDEEEDEVENEIEDEEEAEDENEVTDEAEAEEDN